MKSHRHVFTLIILSSLSLSPPALAQAAAAAASGAKAVARQITDVLTRRAAREGTEALTRELAELGGETALRETVERIAREGGEEALKRAASLVERHGFDAARMLRSVSPSQAPTILRAVDELPAELAPAALRALVRPAEGQALAGLTMRFGPQALEAAARHPGVGASLLGRLGPEGMAVVRSASTDHAVSVLRHADDIAALPNVERAGVLRLIASQPAKAAAFLDAHPKFFLIGGAGAILAANADRIFDGSAEIVIGPDGKPTLVERAGFLERAVITPALHWLLPVLAAILALWGAVKIWGVWREERRAAPPSAPSQPNA